jgi:nicotinamide riboside kinase
MHTEVIVITGPESAGKTTLAGQLSAYWKSPLVAEVARGYLEAKHSYQQYDLLEIAKQQHEKEQKILSQFPKRIVCDTDLLVIMIWSEVKYGRCDSWIYETFENCITQTSTSRHYYLCDSNIPWQADPLRENPYNRNELFELYLQKLRKYELDHSIVTGDPQQRLQLVVDASVS